MAVTKDDIIRIDLTKSLTDLAKKYAKGAELGGTSNVRQSEDRARLLRQDQVVGQLGTIAGHLWLRGHTRDYIADREAQNRDKWKGDGGTDIRGGNIDFKSSAFHLDSNLSKYHLPLRLAELKAGTVYVLALVGGCDWKVEEPKAAVVWLVGWAIKADFPLFPERGGVFEGAHVLRVPDLRPLPPFTWTPEIAAGAAVGSLGDPYCAYLDTESYPSFRVGSIR